METSEEMIVLLREIRDQQKRQCELHEAWREESERERVERREEWREPIEQDRALSE